MRNLFNVKINIGILLLISAQWNARALVKDSTQYPKSDFSYITRSKDKLLDGNKEFKFIGLNTPNLHIQEDSSLFSNGWHRIDEFEIRDAFKTIRVIGGTVTRIYVFSIRGGKNNRNLISHIYAPGKYDESLFKDFDLV